MSLSWKDEQSFSPKTSFDVSGKDIKLESGFSLSNVDETPDNHGLASMNKFRYQDDVSPVHSVPPTVNRTAETSAPVKEKKKCWLLRPVAWLAFLVSVYLMNTIINTTFLLAAYVVDWLSTLPTIAVILLTLAFGGLAIGLLFTGALHLVSFIMSATHTIYPSKNGVRFYIVGAVQLLISLLTIILTLTDPGATHVFWDCAASIYFAIVYIGMLCSAKSIIR